MFFTHEHNFKKTNVFRNGDVKRSFAFAKNTKTFFKKERSLKMKTIFKDNIACAKITDTDHVHVFKTIKHFSK